MKNVRKSKKSLNYDVTPASDPTLTTVKEFERGRKRKRNSGQSYSPYKAYPNRKAAKTKARSIGVACENYRLNCSCKISEEQRKNLFESLQY